ncbi:MULTISPECIES: L-histidine N(alpha)-methyltransferase [unclassified Leptolyngbya]|uniref:L-histidine N(alpha)-methyltransferase n=1 Tax=unclassified Leptolyngbya TaxID=2650499 RepID=UPI001687F8FA|nr:MULTISPECIES: L-histidine N(alpha)-methyltransferase [unclassified Leptolyngbya]MBD1913981.1 L-histidine N(alpha)-methyltransferase [Leptolyngbya sp. FACHB-8]MBD2155948.1 L-histidine N(alpha)-methyltransferase [Leptolyngbya sp. FACHB-16]
MAAILNQQAPVTLYDLHPPLEDFRTEVLQGLSQPQKTLSPKFLYDKTGSELFDAICELDEYYLTRTEMAILQTNAAEIATFIGDGVLVEFGSGSSQKVRLLLDAMPHLETYVALDISKQHLYESCVQLVGAYEGLEAIAICTDYTQPLHLPEIPPLKGKRKVGFFPGSSIGNLEPTDVIQFLKNAAMILEPQGDFLIGVDLKKDKVILEPAYDDAKGVSAAFALNVLTRINRELNANFNLQNFSYKAFYNPIGRIEMYIVSLIEQEVQIGDASISFQAGEHIRTEHSYKYSTVEFQDLAAMAGFQTKCVWTDPDQLFSLHYLHSVA